MPFTPSPWKPLAFSRVTTCLPTSEKFCLLHLNSVWPYLQLSWRYAQKNPARIGIQPTKRKKHLHRNVWTTKNHAHSYRPSTSLNPTRKHKKGHFHRVSSNARLYQDHIIPPGQQPITPDTNGAFVHHPMALQSPTFRSDRALLLKPKPQIFHGKYNKENNKQYCGTRYNYTLTVR